MLVLALDTALTACQAAVLDGDRVLALRSEPMTRGHQERLAPMVQEVMAEAGVGFPALERIGVTVGPGSFTGLRVGLAFAKGLSVALEIPCVGVCTLKSLAADADPDALTIAVIDAPRDRLYLQAFRGGESLFEPAGYDLTEAMARLSTMAASGPVRLVGPGSAILTGALTHASIDARATPDIAALGRWAASAPEPNRRPHPLYLRAPDAKTIAERQAAVQGAGERGAGEPAP